MNSKPDAALAEMAMEMDVVEPELVEQYLEAIPEDERSPESMLAFFAASGRVPADKLAMLRTCWNTAKKLQSKSASTSGSTASVSAVAPAVAKEPEPDPQDTPTPPPTTEEPSNWVAAFEAAETEAPGGFELVNAPDVIIDEPEPEVVAGPATPPAAPVLAAKPVAQPTLPEKFTVICPSCKKGFFAPGAMAGKPGKCGFCKHLFTIPMPPPPKPSTKRASKSSEALSSKTGPSRLTARRPKSKSSPLPMILVGAGILLLGIVLVIVRGDPNADALEQANALIDQQLIIKAVAIVKRVERSGELSDRGQEIKARIVEVSKANREACAGRINERLERGQGAAARRVLEEVRGTVLAADRSLLEEAFQKKIDAALACARAQRLGKEGKAEEALGLIEKLPDELIPKKYAALVMELRMKLLDAASERVKRAAALAWGGDLDEAYDAFDRVADSIGDDKRRKAKRAELAKIAEQGKAGREARKLIDSGKAGAAFALLTAKLREARVVPSARALAKEAEEKFEVALKTDIAQGRLDEAWGQVISAGEALVLKVPRLNSLHSRLRTELRKRERARFDEHLSAGRMDLATAVLEAWRKKAWSPGAAELGQLERALGEARGDLAAEKSRRRFDKLRPRLKKAYEDNDLIAVEGMLTTGSWRGAAVQERLAIEKEVLGQVRALCSAALSALAKRKGDEITLTMRRGGKVTCEIHLVDPPRRELTVKVGAGLAVYKLAVLDWEEIPRLARLAGARKEQAFRATVLAYARGRFEEAKPELERASDRPLAGKLLAIIARGGELASPEAATPPPPEPKPAEPKRPQGPINPGGAEPPKPEPDPAPPGPGRRAGLGDLANGGPEVAAALDLYKRELLAKAREKLDGVLKANPNNADALALRGTIAFDHGRFKEALADLDKAVALDELWADEVNRTKALVAFQYGQDEEAARYLAAIDRPGPVEGYLTRLLQVKDLAKIPSKKGRYLVYSDDAMVKSGGQAYAAKVLDLIYAAYSKIFPFDKDEKIVSRCYIFSRQSAFLSFSARIGHDGTGAAGYFAPLTRILVINADPAGAPVNKYGFTVDAVDTMFHEGFHQFLHFYVPHVPIWFNEGLAEYFGPSILIGKGKLKTGHFVRFSPSKTGASRLEIIKGVVRGEYVANALPLRAFIEQTPAQFSIGGSRTSINYAQGWSFVHFLLHSPDLGSKGRKLIKKYFKIIREGHGSQAAYDATFAGTDMAALEQAWKIYVQRL